MNVQLHNDRISWDHFVASHQESTNYHQYGWREVIERSFGHRTFYLTVKDDEDKVEGILPLALMKSILFGKFLVSLPFVNYGGAVYNNDKAASALYKEASNILRQSGADHVEIRNLNSQRSGLPTKQHKVTMLLDLEKDEDSQWKKFNPKVRNQVRKAERSGLRASVGHIELLDGFYEVFCRNMRDLGTPVYGKKFFKNILEIFHDSTRIISILLDERTIASGFLMWYRGRLEVPWASSIRDFLEMCPNNLLYWEAIKFAIVNNSSVFDFGRSTPDEGTYRFKKQWGARPVPLYWQYLLQEGEPIPELNNKNPRFQKAIRIWQKLPLRLTTMLGPHVVRNIP